MLDLKRAPNTKLIYSQLTSGKHLYMREQSAKAGRAECCLKGLKICRLPEKLDRDALTALDDLREFGKDNLQNIRKAWKYFDKAVDYHPFSIASAGYFKGPFYIGPAQPLILDPENMPKLPPCYCFTPKSKNPMAVSTLKFVEPFGIAPFRKALAKLLSFWEKGCVCIDAMQPHPEDKYLNGRIEEHKALCRLFRTFFITAANMVDFYALRDSFHIQMYSPEDAKIKITKMAEIAKRELQNTKEALDIVKKYPVISYSYAYHCGISAEMCEYKIAHTENLLKYDLPILYYTIKFTRNRHPELLDFNQ